MRELMQFYKCTLKNGKLQFLEISQVLEISAWEIKKDILLLKRKKAFIIVNQKVYKALYQNKMMENDINFVKISLELKLKRKTKP